MKRRGAFSIAFLQIKSPDNLSVGDRSADWIASVPLEQRVKTSVREEF